ncbi:MAG: hypothetical protein MAG451_01147 [Anaerolineales bacterium]|nr:hypothetical protein [Anaerolineales bacterium]
MAENIVIVNTHPGENPEFVGELMRFLAPLGIEPEVIEGYEGENPLDSSPQCIILTGVPMSASYSLAEADTQRLVDQAFGWLRECRQPVLGICYARAGTVTKSWRTSLGERSQHWMKWWRTRGIPWCWRQIESVASFRMLRSWRSLPSTETMCQWRRKGSGCFAGRRKSPTSYIHHPESIILKEKCMACSLCRSNRMTEAGRY